MKYVTHIMKSSNVGGTWLHMGRRREKWRDGEGRNGEEEGVRVGIGRMDGGKCGMGKDGIGKVGRD